MALCRGRPVSLSQTTSVSLWFVIPMAENKSVQVLCQKISFFKEKEKCVLCANILGIYKTNTSVFSIVSAINQVKFKLCSMINAAINAESANLTMLFILQLTLAEEHSVAKKDNFSNTNKNGAREVKFHLIDGREGGEHTVLILWRYAKYLQNRTHLSMERYHLTVYSKLK